MERLFRILRAILIRKVSLRADFLVRGSEGAHNHSMILYLLGSELLNLGVDLSPILLRELIMGASRRKRGYTEYLQHLGDIRALAIHTGNDFMSEVLLRSRRYQFDEVVALLTDVAPQRRIYHSKELESRHPTQDYVPLGVRKSMARKPDLAAIESLMLEQDPSVIHNLLNNPRTIEDIVVKMASLRPTSAQVLEEICAHPKWSARYSVKKSLAFNPYSPPRMVHSLLPTLLLKDLIDVTLSTVLHPEVRAGAKRFIILRISEMSGKEKEQFSERYDKILKRIFLQAGQA
ncbi:MAG: hypothetical protein JSV70_01450 [bacterium]|nr:MAG: hypothetical protein JSV70_01450 [bacterium]